MKTKTRTNKTIKKKQTATNKTTARNKQKHKPEAT